MRVAAAESLLYFGPEAASAVPVLARIMKTNRTDLQSPAIRLLGAIGTAEACRGPERVLTNPEPGRRLDTVQVLKVSDAPRHPSVPC